MALIVATWVWGSKYTAAYVTRLQRAVLRHSELELRVITPWQEDRYLTEVPGCFARLRTFDPAWQAANGIVVGDKVLCLDLDLILTGSIRHLFQRDDPFVILQGVNSSNPNPFNGSVWMLEAGYRPDVWSDFSLEAAANVPYFAFPDDQAWFHAKMPDAGAYGAADGVYAFKKPGWPKGDDLPPNARIVAFPGFRDPGQFTHLDWVRRHWVG